MKNLRRVLIVLFSFSALICLLTAVNDRLSENIPIASNNAFHSALLLIIVGLLVDYYFNQRTSQNR